MSAAITCRRRGRRRSKRSPTRWPRRSVCSTRCATPARSTPEQFDQVYGSISFFVNAGIRFVEEVCKLRALGRDVGSHRPRPLWRHRRTGSTVPIRRAGQLAGPHRGPAGEQRAADRAGDAGGHPVEAGPGTVHPAAGVERGAGPAAPMGPAMVVADATGAGVRERPVGVRRHLRRLAT